MKAVESRAKEKKSRELQPFNSTFTASSPVEGSWTRQLRTLIQNAGVDRGNVDSVFSESETQSSEENSTCKNRKKEIISDEALFKKLKNNVVARSNISSNSCR